MPMFLWIQIVIPLGCDIRFLSIIFYVKASLITYLLFINELNFYKFPIYHKFLKFQSLDCFHFNKVKINLKG